MADITVVQSTVVAANPQTVKASGISGEAIQIGQAVYADPADNYRIKKAIATSATHTSNLVGISLSNTQGANQPITYATGGDVTFGTGLTSVVVYAISHANAGGIEAASAVGTGNFVGVLGVGTSTSNMRVSLIPTSAQI
ncbi:MAG: hypothetical protein ABI970_19825 [Chloroflexota bacterium]